MKPFDRVIGYQSEKNKLMRVVDMLKNRELYRKMGARIPRGILIHGKPGMGKTMLVNAFIEEAGVKTFTIRKNKTQSGTIKQIADTFAQASKEDVAIIFIDDMDKFSSNDKQTDDEAFVAIQSGIDSVREQNVLVVATANNSWKFPESLVRKGRFDIVMHLHNPTESDAKKIIAYYLKDKPVSKDINYEDIYHLLGYSSCAALQSVLNESAIYSASKRKESIDIEDIVMASEGDIGSDDDYDECLNDEDDDIDDDNDEDDETDNDSRMDLDMIAIHEAGHACISEILKKGSVGFVKVNEHSGQSDGGYTKSSGYTKRTEVILLALGGKAATELFYNGRCGSGCQEDLSKALEVISAGIEESGTCGLGLHKEYGQSQFLTYAQEAAARAELERNLFLAKEMLMKNKEFFNKIYEKLRKKKYLLYSDIQKIRDSVTIKEFTV